MNKIKYYIALSFLTISINACSPNLKQDISEKPTNIDFTNYVAIGNSLTSGYQDGALSLEGQELCFPKMIADKMNELYGGTLQFKIPYLTANVSSNGGGEPRFVLGYATDCKGVTSLAPLPDATMNTTLNNVSAGGPYNLVGAPGIRAFDAPIPFACAFNPFFTRFCETVGTSTLVSEALRINPTFYSLWLGNNDVLLYATQGATGNIAPNFPLPGDLSSVNAVANAVRIIADSMSKRGAKGIIANVPDVSAVPYFTTIPWNGAVIDQTTADQLNAIYAGIPGLNITWKAGANPFIIADPNVAHPAKIRQATSADLILLTTPSDSLKCAQWGVSPQKALADAYVLDSAEVSLVKTYTAQYNDSIQQIAARYKVAYADMNTYLKTLLPGIVYNGINMNAQFVSGGTFSLDGVHPNSRGYALVANEFIRTINEFYGTRLRNVDVTKYKGVVFPK